MTPLNLYRADLQKNNFFEDPAQAIAIQQLQRLYLDLQTLPIENKKNSMLSRLVKKVAAPASRKKPFQGIYFYGGVGRGKTYLMDLFFHSLSTQRKQRLHFHHF
ncbi:MAG TPA: AFG1/ZapE family ATPase, partial [Psychromonas sp.]